MKTYKTWEALKMLEENRKAKFELVVKDSSVDLENTILTLGAKEYINFIENGTGKRIGGNVSIDDEWTLIQEPVPFMEAIKAYDKGKTIKCVFGSYHGLSIYKPQFAFGDYKFSDLRDENEGPITQTEILEGKWYIEED